MLPEVILNIETNVGSLTGEQLIDELDFSCYRFNRDNGMTAEALASKYLFGPERGAEMERRYWSEISAYVNARNKRDRETPQWLRELKTGDPR